MGSGKGERRRLENKSRPLPVSDFELDPHGTREPLKSFIWESHIRSAFFFKRKTILDAVYKTH